MSTCIDYAMGLKVQFAAAEFGVSGGGKISRFTRKLMELVSEVVPFSHRKTGAADAFFSCSKSSCIKHSAQLMARPTTGMQRPGYAGDRGLGGSVSGSVVVTAHRHVDGI